MSRRARLRNHGSTARCLEKPRVLVVVPTTGRDAAKRADVLAYALYSSGHLVTVVDARRAALRRSHSLAGTITVSPTLSAHLAGYALQRRGVPWIADVDASLIRDHAGSGATTGAMSRIVRRVILTADVITCATDEARHLAFDRLSASAALVPSDRDPVAALHRQTVALGARRAASSRLRILMIGPINSPHMEHLALAMAQRGHLVAAGGAVWGGGLPPSRLPEMGITVSAMTWPQPVWLRRLVRSFRPHVIHANWMPFAALATLAGARPLVAMAWGSDVYLAGGVQQRANRFALARADAALADSSALLGRLRELGAPRDRLMLLNWGVDLARFKPATTIEKRELKLSLGLGEGPVVISPRGFKDLYNPAVVLAAFERVLAEHPDARLVLKHNGDHVPDLGALGHSSHVHVVGRVSYEEMASYFRAADICVSIPATDSSPRSVWEAMACSCACVLSDLPWVSELIEAERHALVVPADSQSVAAAIRRLLSDSALWRHVTDQARELVEEHRDAGKEMDRLEELYLRLAATSGVATRPATAPSSAAASSAVSWRRE